MTNYLEARVKLKNTQLKKLKSVANNKTGAILRINKKKFEDEELQQELFLTAKQKAIIRDAFVNNMSADIKFIKAQISKKIQSNGRFSFRLDDLGKKAIKNVAIPLARDISKH